MGSLRLSRVPAIDTASEAGGGSRRDVCLCFCRDGAALQRSV